MFIIKRIFWSVFGNRAYERSINIQVESWRQSFLDHLKSTLKESRFPWDFYSSDSIKNNKGTDEPALVRGLLIGEGNKSGLKIEFVWAIKGGTYINVTGGKHGGIDRLPYQLQDWDSAICEAYRRITGKAISLKEPSPGPEATKIDAPDNPSEPGVVPISA